MQVPSAHLKLLLLHPLPSSASLMAATCETPRRTRISGSPPKTGHRVLIPKVFPEACMPSRRSVRGRRGPAATAIAPSFSHRAPFNTAIVVSTVCPLFSLSLSLFQHQQRLISQKTVVHTLPCPETRSVRTGTPKSKSLEQSQNKSFQVSFFGFPRGEHVYFPPCRNSIEEIIYV